MSDDDPADARTHRGATFLYELYGRVQQTLSSQLSLTDSISHDGEKGRVGEELWIKILQQYLPKRFNVSSGIVLDSRGTVSQQIDIVIYDLQYTPTLLGHGSHVYIPAEAVYAVFEVKQAISKETLDYTAEKLDSVRALHRTSMPTISSGRQIPARRLFPIVGGILARTARWSDGLNRSFMDNWQRYTDKDAPQQRIDCAVSLEHGCVDLFDDIDEVLLRQPQSGDAAPPGAAASPDAIAHAAFAAFAAERVAYHDHGAGLIVFLFRLLHILNRIGTVPAVDWQAYAEVISSANTTSA